MNKASILHFYLSVFLYVCFYAHLFWSLAKRQTAQFWYQKYTIHHQSLFLTLDVIQSEESFPRCHASLFFFYFLNKLEDWSAWCSSTFIYFFYWKYLKTKNVALPIFLPGNRFQNESILRFQGVGNWESIPKFGIRSLIRFDETFLNFFRIDSFNEPVKNDSEVILRWNWLVLSTILSAAR